MRYNSIRNRLVAHGVVTIVSLFMCIAGIISFLHGGNIISLLAWASLFCLSLVMWSMVVLIERRRKKLSPSETSTERYPS